MLTSPNLRLREIEGLEEKLKQLKLLEAEGNEILINEDLLMEKLQLGNKSLVGKLHSEHILNKKILWSTLHKVWKTSKPFTIQEIRTNTFYYSFEIDMDKQRVLNHHL